jgi:hypothetical protein
MEEFPLVQGTQQRYGKDKLEILLLSVDLDYGSSLSEATTTDRKRMLAHHISWPNVILPHGFDDSQRLFNLDGYGLTLIGPDGIVRGVDIRPEDAERLLAQIYKS